MCCAPASSPPPPPPLNHHLLLHTTSFITFEDEASVFKVFAAGSHHELGGKRVEVKNATPKGSGPQGRGALDPRTAYLAGRGMGRGYGDLPFGMGPGYMPAGGPGDLGTGGGGRGVGACC